VEKNKSNFKAMKRLLEVENEIRYLSALIQRKSRFGAVDDDDFTINANDDTHNSDRKNNITNMIIEL
jgi:hypothetical protein